MLTSRAHVCGVCEGHPPSALCPQPVTHPAAPSRCSIPPQPEGTYRTGLGANRVSRGHSGQAPWRSYSGLASPAPRTCPPWRLVSMPGRGPVRCRVQPQRRWRPGVPAELRIGSAGAEAWHSWIHSAGNLRGKRGRGEVEEEREGRREGGRQRKGERWMRRDTARWTEWDRPRWLGDQQS